VLLDLAARRNVMFVGGKGGVGKTSIAASIALGRARRGARVLLVSTDPAHNLGHLFGMPIGDGFVEVAPGLDACELDPEATMDTHLAAAERTMRRLMPEHLGGEVTKHLTLARQAPGAAEAAVLERLADVVEGAEQVYDLVVVDTAPSGHTVRMLGLPEVVSAWTSGLLDRQDTSQKFADAMTNLDRRTRQTDPGGEVVPQVSRRQRERSAREVEIKDILLRRQARFAHLRDVITNSERTAFVVVLAAERLPVLETIELERDLARLGAHVDALVINKRSPTDAGDFLAARHRQEDVHLRSLRETLPDIATVEIPLLDADLAGTKGMDRLIALM